MTAFYTRQYACGCMCAAMIDDDLTSVEDTARFVRDCDLLGAKCVRVELAEGQSLPLKRCPHTARQKLGREPIA